MSRPKTDFEALRQDLHQVYEGHPWHGSSITSVLDGISAESAKSRRSGRTTSGRCSNMAVWTREGRIRVRGADAKNPPEDWPVPRFGGGEEAWKSAKKDLAAAQKELEQAVDAIQPDELVRWIGDERDPALGTGTSVGTVIRGLLQHHTYHQGQIALLKRATMSGPQRRLKLSRTLARTYSLLFPTQRGARVVDLVALTAPLSRSVGRDHAFVLGSNPTSRFVGAWFP